MSKDKKLCNCCQKEWNLTYCHVCMNEMIKSNRVQAKLDFLEYLKSNDYITLFDYEDLVKELRGGKDGSER